MHPDKAINAKIMIEGPYGTTEPLHLYENVAFITGGTGISGAVSYLQDHIAKSASHSTKTNSISLIFAAQLAMICDIATHELGPALGPSDVRATFHITSRESAASGKENATLLPCSSSSEIEVSHSRPDVKASILRFVGKVSNARSAGGRIAVLVCGPPAMADTARATVWKNGQREVAYFEETFGW